MPFVALVPLHPPDALQLEALVLCHASTVDSPDAMTAGEAVTLTVGAGEPLATVTDTDLEAEPPGPVQVSTKLVVAASGPTVSVPDSARVPDQPPEAVQLAALAAVHCSVELP